MARSRDQEGLGKLEICSKINNNNIAISKNDRETRTRKISKRNNNNKNKRGSSTSSIGGVTKNNNNTCVFTVASHFFGKCSGFPISHNVRVKRCELTKKLKRFLQVSFPLVLLEATAAVKQLVTQLLSSSEEKDKGRKHDLNKLCKNFAQSFLLNENKKNKGFGEKEKEVCGVIYDGFTNNLATIIAGLTFSEKRTIIATIVIVILWWDGAKRQLETVKVQPDKGDKGKKLFENFPCSPVLPYRTLHLGCGLRDCGCCAF